MVLQLHLDIDPAPIVQMEGGADTQSNQASPPSPDSLPLQVSNLGSVIDNAIFAQSQSHGPSGSLSSVIQMAADADTGLENVGDLGETFNALLDKVALFNKVIDGIGEIYPYVKMPLENQMKQDEDVKDLLIAIGGVYEFLKANIKDPKHLNEHQKHLAQLLILQTVECAYFLQHYMEQTHFLKRAIKGIISNIDEKINTYTTKMDKLMNAFKDQSIAQIDITVVHVYDMVQEIRNDLKLGTLKPVDGASVQQDEICLENTRVEIIDEISAWITSIGDGVPQVFWLCGQAGTGKSAISHTIGQRFKTPSCLGAFFSFNRTYSAEHTPHKALHTLAHNLAYVDQAFQNALVKVLDKDVTIVGTFAIQVQWDNLIVQPAQSLADNCNGPIVIIIDAFDECGDKSSTGRKAL
ncbi:hypothetical protein BT96DRAFT_1080017 [Gymnopus androsaceus JB14]|uniref:Nephrocystin 3-like N-terminal domain-containing protein n=1 Tax=Gymnopus androsaceus JB14 TaxID=1447944 RepID=A0A6A4I3Y5_9AGAR|nr:hypothetical protein BT96DRAFT_1080017 [Gymnopus androsaceus JB14]